MGIVEFVLFCFGEALSFSIIWFTIVSLFFGSPIKQKGKWGQGVYFCAYNSNNSKCSNREFNNQTNEQW